jgi:hypothetical protein
VLGKKEMRMVLRKKETYTLGGARFRRQQDGDTAVALDSPATLPSPTARAT